MRSNPEPPPESDWSWYDWWSRPVINNGRVLCAFVLGFWSLAIVIFGAFLLLAGVLLAAILSFAAAAVLGYLAYRLALPARQG
jgi:hypothetical protein